MVAAINAMKSKQQCILACYIIKQYDLKFMLMENISYKTYTMKNVHPRLGKDCEISKYIRANRNSFANKHVPKEIIKL